MPSVLVAAIFLLGTLMASAQEDVPEMCGKDYLAVACPKEGKADWFRLDEERCLKAFFSQPLLNFTEAEDACVDYGGYLVSIHSYDQLKKVVCAMYRLTPKRRPYWIGLKLSFHYDDYLIYDWTDGTVYDFYYWAYGQPNFYNQNQECVETNLNYWGQWNDLNCNYRRGYVCAVKI